MTLTVATAYTVMDARAEALDKDGRPREGMTLVSNEVLAELVSREDCKACPVVATALEREITKVAQLLERVDEPPTG